VEYAAKLHCGCRILLCWTSSLASILTERGCIHDVAPSDEVLSSVEATSAVQRDYSPQSSTMWLSVYEADVSLPGCDECLKQQIV